MAVLLLPPGLNVDWLRRKCDVSSNANRKGYLFCHENYIHGVRISVGNAGDVVNVDAKCYRSMRKNKPPHLLMVAISRSEISDASCSCTAGLSGACAHVVGLIYTLADFQLRGYHEVPASPSCTSKPAAWIKPRGKKITPQPITELVMAKPRPSRKRQPSVPVLRDNRNIPVCDKDVDILQHLTTTPLSYILDISGPQLPTQFGDAPIGSALTYQFDITHSTITTTTTTTTTAACASLLPNSTCATQTSLPLPSKLYLPPELQICNQSSAVTLDEARQLAETTTQQSACRQWYDARRSRITASTFGEIIHRKAAVNNSLLSRLFDDHQFKTPATQYGKKNEAKAIQVYTDKNPHLHTHECGFIVNPNFSFLGATPDGKVCDNGQLGIIEVKCPFKYRDTSLTDGVAHDKTFCLEQLDGGELRLKKNHKYYCQIQGQLMITGVNFCDLIVYTSCDSHIERIEPDIQFQQTMLNKLSSFYIMHGLPYVNKKAQCALSSEC